MSDLKKYIFNILELPFAIMCATAVLLTYNEAGYIQDALESVGWCDEQIIVDSNSSDGTRGIAKELGAKIIHTPQTEHIQPFDHYRKLGWDAAQCDWIVNIDADEKHPPELQKKLSSIIQQEHPPDVVRAPTINYLNGHKLNGGANWPGYSPVLFKSDAVSVKNRIHTWIDYKTDRIFDLPENSKYATRHDFASSVVDHWRAQRRYAKIAGANREFSLLKFFLAPPWGFYNRFIAQRGWKDGVAGAGIALCWSWFLFETQFRSGIKLVLNWGE